MNERKTAVVSDNAVPSDSRAEVCFVIAANENDARTPGDDAVVESDVTSAKNSSLQESENENRANNPEIKPVEIVVAKSIEEKIPEPLIEEDKQAGGDTLEQIFVLSNNEQAGQDLATQTVSEVASDVCLTDCSFECSSGDTSREALRSILKTNSGISSTKTVTFSETLNCLIDYQDRTLCASFQWNGVVQHTIDEIVREYQAACIKVQAIPIDVIIDQLQDIQDNTNYSAILNLTSIKITGDVINMLEQIFQMVNFRTIYINIEQLESDTSHDIFNMIDYYDPVVELVLSGHKEDVGMWQSFADVAANSSNSLSSVSFREVLIEDQALRIIFDGINSNPHVKIVRFDGCELNRAPTFMLANHLKNNYFLEELHLCFADLYFKEADILGKFLAVNTSLRVLNLSNNKIGDRGFDALTKGLLEQSQKGAGVVVLMLANNRLTKKCASTLEIVILKCPLLHSINVGLNNLTDAVIFEIQEALATSTTLKSFGLQAILLTCSGLQALAKACQLNTSLRHLNLRGNKAVQPEALSDLADVIHRTTLVQIDFDDSSRYSSNSQQYVEVINKIKHMVAVNRIVWEDKDPDQYQSWGREFSLNCEPEFVPQGRCRTRSRASGGAAAARGRFQVTSVPETSAAAPLSPTHRFTVVSVAAASSFVTPTVTTMEEATRGSLQQCESPSTIPISQNVETIMETDSKVEKETVSKEKQMCGSVESELMDSDVVVDPMDSAVIVDMDVDNTTIAHNRNNSGDGDPSKTIDD